MRAVTEQGRIEHLLGAVPDLPNMGKACLYIGASETRYECVGLLQDYGYHITLLEAFKPNADFHKSFGLFDAVIHGDVREQALDYYDLVFWWHGPEHVTHEEMEKLFGVLESSANNCVILATPLGERRQGVVYGNEYEKHISTWYPGDFEKHGYFTSADGVPGKLGANIIAWKWLVERGKKSR